MEKNTIEDVSLLEYKRDKKLGLFIASYYILTTLNIFIKVTFGVSESVYSALSNIVAVGLIIGFVISLSVIIKRAGEMFLIWELIAFILYMFSFVYGYYFSFSFFSGKVMWTMGICVPLGIAAYAIVDKKVLIHYLDIANIIIIVPLCVAMLKLNQNDHSYSMSCAYSLLMPTLMMYYHYFETKKPYFLILGVICTIIIGVFGNRGALLCVVIYLFVKSILLNKSTLSKIVFSGLFLLAVYFIAIDEAVLLDFLNLIISKYDIKSYTITKILRSNIIESNSRQYLWEMYSSKILEKPILGWGAAGGWISAEYYPHNIILEFLLSFGVFLGGIFSLYYLSMYIRVFLCKNRVYRELLLIYAICCVSMFFSGSFLNTPKVFIFILLFLGRKKCVNE